MSGSILTGRVLASQTEFPAEADASPTVFEHQHLDARDNVVTLGWSRTSDVLYVITYSSNTCSRIVQSIRRSGPDQVELPISPSYFSSAAATLPRRDCTADLRALTFLVQPPPGITPDHALEVLVDDQAYLVPPR